MTRDVLLGWRNSSPEASLAFFSPELLNTTDTAELCALFPCNTKTTDISKRIYVIRSPFNIRIRLGRKQNGQSTFQRIQQTGSISENAFRGLVTPVIPKAQRNAETPSCQIALNLLMISDEPCSIQLMPPFLEPNFRGWPGSLVSGRFPVHAWPRPLNAALEWHDYKKDWILKRGDPIAYVMPIYDDPNVRPILVEASLTKNLKRHLRRIDDVSAFGRNVGPMFEEAQRTRPAQLLVPKVKAKR